MAFLIDQLNNSGLFAQSAYSAGIATCDSDGNIITATYLSSVDLTPYQTTAGMTAYATTGDVANKLDTTAFSDVSGTFLTAHQSLDGYATTAWVDSQGYLTAHQPISADEWNNVYDTVNVYSGSWTGSESSPTASVDSNGSIDIVSSNNTVYFDVNGTWFNNAVNSAVDVPTGVMVESACQYNAVNEISGYNGSAIAQYGAEKQWLVHDDTIVHVSNSAQYALGVNISAVAQLLGIDETVLWIGELSVGQTATLSEPYSSFKKIEFKYKNWTPGDNGIMSYESYGTDFNHWSTLNSWLNGNLKAIFIGAYSAIDDTHVTLYSATFNNITETNQWSDAALNYRLYEIRGIGRKA